MFNTNFVVVIGWHRRINTKARRANLPFYMLVPLLHQEGRLVNLQMRLVAEQALRRQQTTVYRRIQGKIQGLWDQVRIIFDKEVIIIIWYSCWQNIVAKLNFSSKSKDISCLYKVVCCWWYIEVFNVSTTLFTVYVHFFCSMPTRRSAALPSWRLSARFIVLPQSSQQLTMNEVKIFIQICTCIYH